MEGGAGGDHGVDAVFFFYLKVDEERFAASAGAGGCGDDVRALADVGSGDAVGCG